LFFAFVFVFVERDKHFPESRTFAETRQMSRLTRIGLFGLGFVALLSSIVALCGGFAIYTAPLAIPFSVMILIGLNNKPKQS
jgi:NAD/NADP transhydrogenase alpha subunit